MLLAILMLALSCRSSSHVQAADPSFDSFVARPFFLSRGATLLFDDAHNNFHRSDGRYSPFITLMRNDGLTVASNRERFSGPALEGHDILVIVNAEGLSEGAPAFDDAEVEAVAEWVEGGGGLLLVADHRPFGQSANNLSERLGVKMLDAYLKDPGNSDPSLPGPFFILFTRENGLIGAHPIMDGGSSNERVERVVTFGGQALVPRRTKSTLLALAPTAEIVRDRARPGIGEPIPAGAVQAVAFDFGKGRVVILGEAAALTAQVITGDAAKSAGVEELRIGMSRGDLDNKQFALNIIRWLARRIG